MKVGEVRSWSRTFTEDDVRAFAQVSGDNGEHHFVRDKQGRLMIHGLLTATLPTKIGGDMNFIARNLNFQFHRPVFVGDTIDCRVTLVSFEQREGYADVVTDWKCVNEQGKEVMTGTGTGIVRD